jgi:hypothetical protein
VILDGADAFLLLVAHLTSDFLVQDDWQAGNKTNPHPGKEPHPQNVWMSAAELGPLSDPDLEEQKAWWAAQDKWHVGHLACTVHCVLYTLCIWLFSFWWMPWWGLAVVFLLHWPVDRFRLARVWMECVSHQKAFANGPLSPWSVIVVDQCWHLLTLAGLVAWAKWLG